MLIVIGKMRFRGSQLARLSAWLASVPDSAAPRLGMSGELPEPAHDLPISSAFAGRGYGSIFSCRIDGGYFRLIALALTVGKNLLFESRGFWSCDSGRSLVM